MRRLALHIAALLLLPATLAAGFAAPATAQFAGPFIVFFESGSTDVSDSRRAVLDNVVEAYLAGDKTRQLMVNGHTDLAAEAEAAVRESQLRAKNVRDYLVSKGVPETLISTDAFGNTHPLVETPAGVSEPQNRRVEITFGPGGGW